MSWSWDEMWTWKDPNFKFYFVSYERFDGEIPQSAHQLAISFGCCSCCDGADLSPGSVPHRLTCPRPVPHLHIGFPYFSTKQFKFLHFFYIQTSAKPSDSCVYVSCARVLVSLSTVRTPTLVEYTQQWLNQRDTMGKHRASEL